MCQTLIGVIGFSVLSLLMAPSLSYERNDYNSIELPIKSRHDLEIINTHSEENSHSTHVEVPGGGLPVYITFNTQSSPVYVRQAHSGTQGSYQHSNSMDEAHHLSHEVVKPIYQELREIIQPYRKVFQVIEPVREELMSTVYSRMRGRGNENDQGNGRGNENGQGNGRGNENNQGNGRGNGHNNEQGYKYGVLKELYRRSNNEEYKQYRN